MSTKCTGIMGRVFGHTFIAIMIPDSGWTEYRKFKVGQLNLGLSKGIDYCICQRCGTVTGKGA